MAEAFALRHKATMGSYEISITLKAQRLEKVEGFSLTAQRSGTKVDVTIGLTLEHSLRYALNALRTWLSTSETQLDLIDGPDFPIRGVVEGFP
jgi:hypothetical protein